MVQIKQVTRLSEIGINILNEDVVLVNENTQLFGVFDGATSLNRFKTTDGKTGGYIAAHIAAETFASTDLSLKEIAFEANMAIDECYESYGVIIRSNVDRFNTTAAAIKIHGDSAELLQVADSIIIFIYEDGRVEVPLGYHDHDIDVMRKWRALADEGWVNIREILIEDIIGLRKSANTNGFGSMNGQPEMEDFIHSKTVSLDGVSTILILTDGMYLPKEDPDADENWMEYARLYGEGGLQKIYTTVRGIEDSDPHQTKYPRYKMHDDASGIAIDLA